MSHSVSHPKPHSDFADPQINPQLVQKRIKSPLNNRRVSHWHCNWHQFAVSKEASSPSGGPFTNRCCQYREAVTRFYTRHFEQTVAQRCADPVESKTPGQLWLPAESLSLKSASFSLETESYRISAAVIDNPGSLQAHEWLDWQPATEPELVAKSPKLEDNALEEKAEK